MQAESWNFLISAATFMVIAASAYAALAQLRHINTTNQLNSLLFVLRLERNEELQQHFRFLREHYRQMLLQDEFAESIRASRFDRAIHRELFACDWYEEVGALLKHKLMNEAPFLDMVCPKVIVRDWEIVQPTIAAARRVGGSSMFMNFEYLAARSQKFLEKSPEGIYPADTPRLVVRDA